MSNEVVCEPGVFDATSPPDGRLLRPRHRQVASQCSQGGHGDQDHPVRGLDGCSGQPRLALQVQCRPAGTGDGGAVCSQHRAEVAGFPVRGGADVGRAGHPSGDQRRGDPHLGGHSPFATVFFTIADGRARRHRGHQGVRPSAPIAAPSPPPSGRSRAWTAASRNMVVSPLTGGRYGQRHQLPVHPRHRWQDGGAVSVARVQHPGGEARTGWPWCPASPTPGAAPAPRPSSVPDVSARTASSLSWGGGRLAPIPPRLAGSWTLRSAASPCVAPGTDRSSSGGTCAQSCERPWGCPPGGGLGTSLQRQMRTACPRTGIVRVSRVVFSMSCAAPSAPTLRLCPPSRLSSELLVVAGEATVQDGTEVVELHTGDPHAPPVARRQLSQPELQLELAGPGRSAAVSGPQLVDQGVQGGPGEGGARVEQGGAGRPRRRRENRGCACRWSSRCSRACPGGA